MKSTEEQDFFDWLDDFEEELAPQYFYCLYCGRSLPIENGVIVHDEVEHPETYNFSEEDRPQ